MTVNEVFTVRYSGGSSGSGALTLGQDNMIRCILAPDSSHMNKQAVWPVPAGADLPAVLNALRTLAERHESLRTVFPGPPDDQPTHQLVQDEGEFTVTVVEAAEDADAEAVATELGRLGRADRFELATEFALRLTVVTQGGRPAWLLLVVCHAHLDGSATGLLFGEWMALAAGQTLPPHTGRTPLQVAESETSKVGRRKAKAALRHWERILRTSPQAVFADDRVELSDKLLPTLVVGSVAAAQALERAGQRTGTSASTVLLAAYSALVGHRAAQPEVVIAALSANRHRPGFADHIGTIAQDALLSLDVEAADFDELVGRTKAAALGGYWHSTLDADQIWRMIDDTAHLRGARFGRQVVLNDLSLSVPDAAADSQPEPSADPELTWLPKEILPARLMLNIWKTRGSLVLTLHADPLLFTAAETEQFAQALLRLITLAADGPVPLDDLTALTGIVPGTRERGEWHQVDHSWIELTAVRHLLAIALDKRPVELSVQDGRLTARIAEDGRPLTPVEAHAAVIATLPGHDLAMAPHHYVVHDGPHVLAEGSGRGEVTDWQVLLG